MTDILNVEDANTGDIFEIHFDDGKIVTTAYEHEKIHSGDMFFHSIVYSGVGNGASVYLGWNTGSHQEHINFEVIAGGAVDIYWFEDSVFTGGTQHSAVNKNFTSTNECESTFYQSPNVTNQGTLILSRYLAGGNTAQTRIGGSGRTYNEWVLNSNSSYLMKITNTSGSSTIINLILEYYEEDHD